MKSLTIIDKLLLLADWFDSEQSKGRWKGEEGLCSVQDDLRNLAHSLERFNESISDMSEVIHEENEEKEKDKLLTDVANAIVLFNKNNEIKQCAHCVYFYLKEEKDDIKELRFLRGYCRYSERPTPDREGGCRKWKLK